MSIIEHISFHYSTFPDTLSELVNYYDVDLIKCNGSWYVSDVTSTNDDFDAIYKGSEFTAEKADEIIALRDAHSLNDTSAIEAIINCTEAPELHVPTVLDKKFLEGQIRTILEEHSWNVEENTVKPRFQIRHEPEFKDASLINTTDLEQWFGGQDGMSTILNSLQMFEQN